MSIQKAAGRSSSLASQAQAQTPTKRGCACGCACGCVRVRACACGCVRVRAGACVCHSACACAMRCTVSRTDGLRIRTNGNPKHIQCEGITASQGTNGCAAAIGNALVLLTHSVAYRVLPISLLLLGGASQGVGCSDARPVGRVRAGGRADQRRGAW